MKIGHNYPILKGLKVIEMEGYLPVAFLGKLLRDFGAEVYLIKSHKENSIMQVLNYLHEGKRSITLNLAEATDLNILKQILNKSDILIEGYRPGVLERLGLDPDVLMQRNSKLITVRVSGYGQEGLMHSQPGHEINYLSFSGTLDFFRNEDNKIINPMIILGDLFCGSLMPFYHISQALLDRKLNGGNGCVIDTSITTNLLSMAALTNKFDDDKKFYLSCVTKDYDYILIYLLNDEDLNYYLRRVCERLLIEVLNVSSIDEGARLGFTRDYIDFFQLMTKSISDSVKYIKELTKWLSSKEVIKNLKKIKNVEVYPCLQFKDLLKFFKDTGVVKGENMTNPFNIELVTKISSDKQQAGELGLQGSIVDVLKNFSISEDDLKNYVKDEQKRIKPKL